MGCGASAHGELCASAAPVNPSEVIKKIENAFTPVLKVSGKATDVLDLTICHSHDPYVATVQSWFKGVVSKLPGMKVSQSDFDKYVKDFFKSVKQYNVDTGFSASNALPSHLDALKKKFEEWKAQTSAPQPSGGISDKLDDLAQYTQIIIYAGVANLLNTDDKDEIATQMTKYTEVDLGWATTVLARLGHPGAITYRAAPSVDSYVYPLKSLSGNGSTMRIALLSDWGTGTPQAYDMLSKIAALKPDLSLHLGDCYYSGTQEEEEAGIWAPVEKHLKGTQFYNLPGNHDYYAGGDGYLKVVDDLRKVGYAKQESSFFCLEGDQWVIIAMDTALHDANPLETVTGAAMTWLEDSEAAWVKDKVKKAKAAGKKVMWMSHHQWCTLHSTVGKDGDKDQALNTKLYNQLSEVIGDVDVWYWGHEHNLVFFDAYAGLKRGRLIGNGSVPVLTSSDPYKVKDLQVPSVGGVTGLPTLVPGAPQMSVADFGYYYNNNFVILELDGSTCQAMYYDIPWISATVATGLQWGPARLMYTETF